MKQLENSIIEGQIERLAFGGRGVLRYDNFVVFVPFVAPGERVRVKVVQQHKSYADAELYEVITPSPKRQQAPCPYYGQCGGCQLQHLDYTTQAEQKQHFVEDALIRIGKLQLAKPVEFFPTEHPWAYRRHIRLTLFSQDDQYAVGYVGNNDVEVVSVNRCAIFIPQANAVLRALEELVVKLDFLPEIRAHISVIKDEAERFVLYFDFPGAIPANIDHVLHQHLVADSPFSGALWRAGRRSGAHGKTHCSFSIDGLKMTYSPVVFVQSHPEQSAQIYRQIVAFAQACGVRKVLDLYCGIGVTSLLLAKQGIAVVGVEANPDSITLAKQNAHHNSCEQVHFERADVAKVTRRLLKEEFDLVVLNPPRTGVDKQTLAALAEGAPKHLIYVSCMPPTLARDLAALSQRGYKIQNVHAYDMFPQTTHVESVVLLTKESL